MARTQKELVRLVRDETDRVVYALTREERPRFSDRVDLVIDHDRWELLKNFRPRAIATWSLHNRGAQTINYSMQENDPFPSQLGAGDLRSYDTDPDEVWVQRTSAVTSPTVHLEYWFWDD